jgi:hypothetical protein
VRRPPNNNAIAFAEILLAFSEGPCTVKELQERTGLRINTVYEYIRAAHKRKAIYRSGWHEGTGRGSTRYAAMYSLGVGRDVQMPRLTTAQNNENRNARRRMKKLINRITGVSSNELPQRGQEEGARETADAC